MTRRIVVFPVVLCACLVGRLGLLAAEPTLATPQLIDPEQESLSIEERLSVIEDRLRLIEQHLRLTLKVPLPDVQDSGLADLIASSERITKLESESRTISDRLQSIQSQLDELKPTAKPLVPEPAQGRFVIRNWTGVTRCVSVNGLRFNVHPGWTEIKVPHALVEAYLPGFEAPKLLGMSNWRWTGQDYEMRLDIRSRF